MDWNWQQKDWPDFRWDSGCLASAEEAFLIGGGVLLGSLKHLGPDERSQFTIDAISSEAVTTSEIEGEMLDRLSVQSSIRKQLGLAADPRLKPRRLRRFLPKCGALETGLTKRQPTAKPPCPR